MAESPRCKSAAQAPKRNSSSHLALFENVFASATQVSAHISLRNFVQFCPACRPLNSEVILCISHSI